LFSGRGGKDSNELSIAHFVFVAVFIIGAKVSAKLKISRLYTANFKWFIGICPLRALYIEGHNQSHSLKGMVCAVLANAK
jgi:hypothetical protein